VSGEILIAGGGLGGLAAALAARHAGWEARLVEQAQAFSEVGAGIQLGPNATAILREWGLLQRGLEQRVARPGQLCVRDARTGDELGTLRLGQAIEQRYGAPYLTVHRADLQQALLEAAQAAGVRVHTGTRVDLVQQQEPVVKVCTGIATELEADALVAADGVWSRVREQVLADGAPRFTGHLAYRGLVRQADLPAVLRSADVTAWLGPRMHVVGYPVRGGEWLNVVCLVEGRLTGDARGWDHEAVVDDLHAAMANACAQLRDLVHATPGWRLWALNARQPVRNASEMAQGRIALLGDAAHPMLPYLAQGAGMALEDARELQRVLTAVAENTMDVPTALRRYALNRWQRCARVQRRSQRNALIFHAAGPLRWGRDLGMRMLGERLIDLPWLYGY
jgi:salicylate hydroxylase